MLYIPFTHPSLRDRLLADSLKRSFANVLECFGVDVCFGIEGDSSFSHGEAIPIDCIILRCLVLFRLNFRRGVTFSYASEQSDLSESENPESWLLRS